VIGSEPVAYEVSSGFLDGDLVSFVVSNILKHCVDYLAT
jgi:hypothetical protein